MHLPPRLKTAGLLLAILIVGFGIIVAATERSVGARDGSAVLSVDDLAAAFDRHGLDVVPSGEGVQHPSLSVAGTRFLNDSTSIDVYVYQTVSERVEEEQRLHRSLLQLQSLATDGDQPFRITSARNVLLIIHSQSVKDAGLVYAAARDLASGH